MRKYRIRQLFGPGPSTAHPNVLAAMAQPLMGHLDPDFLATMDEVSTMLREVFQTRNRVTFPVSGTGTAAMEMTAANLLEPGDIAVVGIAGLFGDRFAQMARRAGAQVREVRVEWGHPLTLEEMEPAMDGAKIVMIVHAETSVGMQQPVPQIAAAARSHGALMVVDAVTSFAGIEVDVDGWGIDVCYAGTQKCLSVPPGLAPITFSDAAVAAINNRREPPHSWYLDVGLLTKYWGAERAYHHTAPISMVYALHEGLRLALAEGLRERWDRHTRLGGVVSSALDAMGFSNFAQPGYRLPHVQAVRLPDSRDADSLRRGLLDRFDIEIGGGVGPMAGNAWRIGLMGESCHEDRIEFLLEAIREVIE